MNLYSPSLQRAGPLEGLSIGELSRRTGLGVSTLRAWETRHGFPSPRRLPGGHRRYSERDVQALLAVVRDRQAGARLDAALASARVAASAPRTSIMATLREVLPDVRPIVLSRTGMLAVSRAIEDEAATRADRPLLAGAFQSDRFWQRSKQRWAELAVRSEVAIALGARKVARPGLVWQVPIEPRAPMRAEWAVICDAPNLAACLVGVELPRRRPDDTARRFECIWSVEPHAVRETARTAVALAAVVAPEVIDAAAPRLGHAGPSLESTARAATALTNRIIAYLA